MTVKKKGFISAFASVKTHCAAVKTCSLWMIVPKQWYCGSLEVIDTTHGKSPGTVLRPPVIAGAIFCCDVCPKRNISLGSKLKYIDIFKL